MREDEVLERAVVFQNLSWSWSFYGLQMHHFAIAGAMSLIVLFVALLCGFNMLYGIAFFMSSSAGLAVLQWRKPASYIPELFNYLVLPRYLSCLDDDRASHPFPVPREELRS